MTHDYLDHIERPREDVRENDDETEALASSVAEVATGLLRKTVKVMDRVRAPGGRVGTVSQFSDADRDMIDGHSTSAKVVFDDGQWAYYPVSNLTRV
jgi:hypothetical protein